MGLLLLNYFVAARTDVRARIEKHEWTLALELGFSSVQFWRERPFVTQFEARVDTRASP